MSKQIRINKTAEIEEMLKKLKNHYKILSEAEIFKKALVNEYLNAKKNALLIKEAASSYAYLASHTFGVSSDMENEEGWFDESAGKPVNYDDFR